MTRPYSVDLRERVVRAVEAGLSRRAAARRFEVSVSFVVKLDTSKNLGEAGLICSTVGCRGRGHRRGKSGPAEQWREGQEGRELPADRRAGPRAEEARIAVGQKPQGAAERGSRALQLPHQADIT